MRSTRSIGMRRWVYPGSDGDGAWFEVNAATIELSSAAKSKSWDSSSEEKCTACRDKTMKLCWPHACSEQTTSKHRILRGFRTCLTPYASVINFTDKDRQKGARDGRR